MCTLLISPFRARLFPKEMDTVDLFIIDRSPSLSNSALDLVASLLSAAATTATEMHRHRVHH
jgi:hypothetical protein